MYTDKVIERLILTNPFKRFKDMDMMHYSRTLGLVMMDKSIWKRFAEAGKKEILPICDDASARYYIRFRKRL